MLSNNLIKIKITLEWTHQRNGSLFIACNAKKRNVSLFLDIKIGKNLIVSNIETYTHLLDYVYIRFGTKLYREIIGIPVDTYCAPFIGD